MPYFIYNVFPDKKLELVAEMEKFREAKLHARALREEQLDTANYTVKIIFAKNSMEAQLLLKEEREARPLGDD